MHCTYITDLEELRGYEGPWEELRRRCGGSIFTSHYVSRAWLEAFGSTTSPCVIVVEDGGEAVGIAPLIHKRLSFLGMPVRALSFVGDADRKLALDPLRFLVPPDRPEVMDKLVSAIGRLGWNFLNINYMEDTEEIKQVVAQVQRSWDSVTPAPMTTTFCPLPAEGDLLDRCGSHARHKLGQALRKAEREVGLEFRIVPPERVGDAVKTYVQQHIERWEAKGGSIFRDQENVAFLDRVIRAAAEKGDAMVYELLMNGEVAAQEFSFKDGDLARGYRLGMNNAYAKYAPGMLITYLVMTAYRDRGFRAFSRGSGGESYKLRLGGEERALIGVQARRGMVSWLSRASSVALRRPRPAGEVKGLAGQTGSRDL